MANETAIGWTDLSWNPVHGCSVVSPGCAHCYAATLSLQRGFTSLPWTPENAAANVTVKEKKLGEPKSGAKIWRGLGEAAARAGKTEGKLVFVNSMSDLFHEQVPDEFIAQVFVVMARARKHAFQILTKRPERMLEWFENLDLRTIAGRFAFNYEDGDAAFDWLYANWPLPNVWLGVSIENRRYVDRADLLRQTPAAVRFVSAEPLLGPLVYEQPYDRTNWSDGSDPLSVPPLDLTDIDWLIVGGESGPGHRPMHEEWARDLRDACAATGPQLGSHSRRTAFFFKQWGGARPTSGGRELDGRTWDEFPQVRAARAEAERRGKQAVLDEAMSTYRLIYRARGRTGPDPLPSVRSPGLLGWTMLDGALPMVVGR